MSDPRLFGLFSGTHIVILVLGLLTVPSALYATVTYSNVALVNPTTGVAASVDTSGHLMAINPYSYYKDYPGEQIDILVDNSGSACETTYQYAVPSGRAFVVTAISGYTYSYSTSTTYTGVDLYAGVNCTGKLLTSYLWSASSTAPYNPVTAQYGVGIPVAAGSTISVQSFNDAGRTHIHGYLVPSTWITAAQDVGAAAAPNVAAKSAAFAR